MYNKLTKTAALLLSGMLAISLFTGCEKQEESASVANIKVETTPAEYGTLEISTDYIGTLAPNLTVDVMPLVAGTVEKIHVEVGDKIRAGDLLCQLDDTSADLSVRSAEDAVDTAIAGKDAANSQAGSAKLQADANVKTLETTLKSYQSSLKKTKKQLKKLEDSKKSVQAAQKKAQKSYVDAKKRYKTAQALLIQFETFLNENPDCRTTAGLTAAATAVITAPDQNITIPSQDKAVDIAQIISDAGETQTTEGIEQNDSQTEPTAESTDQALDNSAADYYAASVAKQKQAQALLKALTEAGLTVEYLGDTGLHALSEDVTDGETAYGGASSSTTQLETSITTLKSNIEQLEGQISATKDNLESAKKLAAAASMGTEVYDAQIEAAKTGVDAAKYQKDLYRLTSPIDGVVDAVNVKENGMAAQGYAAFTISEKDSMVADFYVTEDVKNFLKVGDQIALLKKNEEEKVEDLGSITLISPAADPQRGLFKIEAEIVVSGKKEYSSGSTVKLSVVSNAVSGQILIPYDSVYYDDGQAYVYRVINGQATRTDIETGLFNQDYITVSSGLTAGDSIITTWASGLKDGAVVDVVNGVGSEDDSVRGR